MKPTIPATPVEGRLVRDPHTRTVIKGPCLVPNTPYYVRRFASGDLARPKPSKTKERKAKK